VGNTPVQEVYAGRQYYNCHVGVVLTNSIYTKGAVELAKATNVLLWDSYKLYELIEKAGLSAEYN
ncbi:MAG: restriction endonuclease, partial [Phascolarctobacterium sp.]|nr:restriction endonuclease [Phascolarctobacterium sp.]